MNKLTSSLAAIDAAAVALIVAGAFGTYWLGIAPAQRAAAAERANHEGLAVANDQLDEAMERLQNARSSLESLHGQVEANATVLRPGSELFARIGEITQKAQARALTISGTSPSAPVVGKRYNRIPIHLSGVGSYANFAAFIEDLHRSYSDLQVLSFKLTDRADDPKAQAAFEADLSWYTSTDKPAGAAGSNGEAGKGAGGAGGGGGGSGGASGLSNPAAPGPGSPRGNP
jgi:Tfp pilus assembly protein PilO